MKNWVAEGIASDVNDFILEARAEIQKYFRWVFGSNENFEICFRD